MTSALTLEAQIEALLLYKGGSLRLREIEKITGATADQIKASLLVLENTLSGRGSALVRDADRVALSTAGAAAPLIDAMRRDELEGPVGKAGLETLAIIVYKGPVSRAEIEYIRGVNVSTTLRSLMIRGLIERVENPDDKRSFLYRPTIELPAYLGVTALTDLDSYDSVRAELHAIIHERASDDTHDA